MLGNMTPTHRVRMSTGFLENRIYYTTKGKTWHITIRPFAVDFFERAGMLCVGRSLLLADYREGFIGFDR